MINLPPLPWTIAQPGGPDGPFYGVVASNGNVVALHIFDEQTAVLITKLPQLLSLLKTAEKLKQSMERSAGEGWVLSLDSRMALGELFVLLDGMDGR